ncbi:hypothetical protein SAMN04515620_13424 [Collimonas sp. OK607]|uniref:SMI1/KNR4 family protein n=1 Tax=Collimonas sp. OK607 TaxID=1798194 RepID=UPI0008EF393F|nr:SMI1/KNR4 family protein [Collimonas sp. OK607]SFB27749.1 hypothetical protein SAMN04515620_13424 [Collimonas sp. OK607]
MKHLKALVEHHNADTRPVDKVTITSLEKKLGFALSAEYMEFLSESGLIEFEANEM